MMTMHQTLSQIFYFDPWKKDELEGSLDQAISRDAIFRLFVTTSNTMREEIYEAAYQ